MPDSIGGEVLQRTCECKGSPWRWFPLPTGGFWSKPLACWQAGRLPKFCLDCGAELRADGTAVTRLRLPAVGEPKTKRWEWEDGEGVHRVREASWGDNQWKVELTESVCGEEVVYRVTATTTAHAGKKQCLVVAAILVAERKRGEWQAEREAQTDG